MEESFEKRYFIKFISTVLITLINASIQLILPRVLSMDEYANYTYNLNVFTSVLAIAMLSMDSAFASKISKRLEEIGIIYFYRNFLAVIIILLNIFISLLFVFGINSKLFEGQGWFITILALNASISLKLLQEVTSLFDCFALTKFSEPFIVVQKIGLAVGVYILYVLLLLNIKSFYILQIVLTLIIVMLMLKIFKKRKIDLFIARKRDQGDNKYFFEFAEYCKPMIASSIISNLIIIVSNWLLKRYGGNNEQAFYGVAWQLNSLIICTFAPITVLLQREFAIRMKDKNELCNFYKDILRKVILIVSFFACFVIVNADITLKALFGEKYFEAADVTKLIMIYTIFQAWGQVNGSMYTASERTKVYARLSVLMQILSVTLIYIFQMPNFIWHEGLGAIGIGLQKTVSNIISVMILGYVNCRFLKIKWLVEYKTPLISTTVFCLVAYACRFLYSQINLEFMNGTAIITFIILGVMYCINCVIIYLLCRRYIILKLRLKK